MTEFQKGFLTLIRYALSDEETCPPLAPGFDYTKAIAAAQEQQLTPLLYYGVSKVPELAFGSVGMKLMNRAVSYISHSAKQAEALRQLTDRLAAAGIDYMPFKGTILKELYPAPEMRVMGDCDLLIRPGQWKLIKPIIKELNYKAEAVTDHVLEYETPDRINIEFHKHPIPREERDLYRYYGDGWWTAQPVGDNPYHYTMRPEDHYVFQFAHFVKHYRGAGAGIKFVLDFRVFEKAYPDMDMDYIRGELTKMGLCEFFDNIRRTMAVWFDGAESDEMTDHLTDRLFDATVFGQDEQNALSAEYRDTKAREEDGKQIGRKQNKLRHWLSLFFLPYSDMKKKYPVLVNWAILLPLFWIVRGFDILFNRRDRIGEVSDGLDKLSPEQVEQFRAEMNYVGLDKRPEDLSRPKK